MKTKQMEKSNEEIIGSLAVSLLKLVTNVGGFILQGYVLVHLWLWFVVPLGVTGLNTAMALGLLLVARFAVKPAKVLPDVSWPQRLQRIEKVVLKEAHESQVREEKEKEDLNRTWDELGTEVGRSIIFPLICWGIGYLIHLFI